MARTKKARKSNPAELILVNPGSPGRKVYKRRASTGNGSVKKGNKMATTKRKPISLARRKAIAKKAAATRKRNARAASRKTTTKRRTKPVRKANPKGVKSRFGSMNRAQLVEEARKLGLKTTGTSAQIKARVQAKRSRKKRQLMEARGVKPVGGGQPRSPRKTKKATKKKVARKAKKSAKSRTSVARRGRPTSKRSWKKTKKTRITPAKSRKRKSASRGVTSLQRARRSILTQKVYGRPLAKKYLRAHGMTKVNPSMKSVMQDAKVLLPYVGVTVGSMVGMLALGAQVQKRVSEDVKKKLPDFIGNNLGVASTVTATALAFTAAKMLGKGKMQKYSVPILVGGLTAATAQWMFGGSDSAKKLRETLGLGGYTTMGGIFDGYTSVGGADDQTPWEDDMSGYARMAGMDDQTPWEDDMSGLDDQTPWEDDTGVLSGGIF